jgi:hypothetical protein
MRLGRLGLIAAASIATAARPTAALFVKHRTLATMATAQSLFEFTVKDAQVCV